MGFLLALLISFDPTTVDEVDVIELNHVFAYNMVARRYEPRLVQFIFYRDDHVVSWQMWNKTGNACPIRVKGGYELIYFDENILRVIKAKAFIHTQSDYDHEVDERLRLPVNKRRGLTRENYYLIPYEG